MKLNAYWKTLTPAEKRGYAEAAGTTVDYVKQLTGGHAKPGPALARKLAKASRGKIRLSDLRPEHLARFHGRRLMIVLTGADLAFACGLALGYLLGVAVTYWRLTGDSADD